MHLFTLFSLNYSFSTFENYSFIHNFLSYSFFHVLKSFIYSQFSLNHSFFHVWNHSFIHYFQNYYFIIYFPTVEESVKGLLQVSVLHMPLFPSRQRYVIFGLMSLWAMIWDGDHHHHLTKGLKWTAMSLHFTLLSWRVVRGCFETEEGPRGSFFARGFC